jgi:hypothetical protein
METRPGFDQESVLALVNELHAANPAKRSFTLMEIADAMWGPGSASFAVATLVDPEGRSIKPRRLMPAWMDVLNNILTNLGEEDALAVTTVAVVVFAGGQAVVESAGQSGPGQPPE